METAMHISFNSLPYPLFENDWDEMKRYKQLAIKKEDEILTRRRKRNEELLSYVTNKIKELETKSKLIITKDIIDDRNVQVRDSPIRPVRNKRLISGIPVPSPPKSHAKPSKYNNAKGTKALSFYSVDPYHPPKTGYYNKAVYSNSNRSTTSRTKSVTDPFCHVSAVVKGFLTRRLLKSEKIEDIVITIKDAEQVLQSLASPGTIQECDLQQRIINQLQTAKFKLHHIFFELSPGEKMRYIAHSRALRRERQMKRIQLQEMKKSRLSTATLRAIERKKKQVITSSTTKRLVDKSGTNKIPSIKQDNKRNTSTVTTQKQDRKKTDDKVEETKLKYPKINKASSSNNKKSFVSSLPRGTRTIHPPTSGKFQKQSFIKNKS